MTNKAAIESTHADVAKMIHQLAWKFTGNGVSYEDCLSAAGVGFMRAYKSWTPEKSSFVTWCYHCVYRAIQTIRVNEAEHNSRFPTNFLASDFNNDNERVGGADQDPPDREPSFLASITTDLSEDARTVIRMVLESPQEIAGRSWKKDPNPLQARRTMWRRFKSLGWTLGQFVQSCDEIREALR
jgi:DNA-directed RNA polymerase specialized sigma24 family protein